MRKTITTAAIAATVWSAVSAMAATPADKCEASKNKTAGKYYACREKAESTAIKTGLPVDYSKCTAKFDSSWDKAETTGAGDCPDTVLTAPMNAFLAGQATAAAAVIAGGDFPAVCGNGLVTGGEQCDVGNLNGATCATQPGFTGGTLACAAGCTFDTTGCYATRFDASGATILDHQTGLEWEKKDSAGGGDSGCPGGPTCANPHDVDNYYQWSTSFVTEPNGPAFTDFLAKLNGSDTGICYAGHCDWRLPTREELLGVPWPANAAFLPDRANGYWSASTSADNPLIAWYVDTLNGNADTVPKPTGYFVRAVRSGS